VMQFCLARVSRSLQRLAAGGVAALLGLALPVVGVRAAEAPGVLTLLDGEAQLIVGARVLVAATGLRLPAGSIVETDDKTALLRVEWPDGSRIDLGPATRVMLRPAGAPKALAYVLRGVVKQTQDQATAGLVSAEFELKPFQGVVVLDAGEAAQVLFAERGTESAIGRRGNVALSLKPGQAAVAPAGAPATVQPRPPVGWLAGIPRAFRDTLPSRLAQASALAPAPKAKPAPAYAAVQPWLAAEPLLRRELPQRWSAWLDDRAFREAVLARLPQHPEWEPLVRPPPARPAVSTAVRRPVDNPASAPEPQR
jgi:hypothetical protein